MLEKITQVGQIEITASSHIQVRTDTVIIEDGEPLGEPQYHRHVIAPGDDYSAEDPKVQAICEAVHTPDVVAAYQAARAAAQAELEQEMAPPEPEPEHPEP